MKFELVSRWGFALAATIILSGCVSTASTVKQIDQLESVGDSPKIVLMPPDIKYYLLTAAGVPQPHEEWTTAARENFSTAVVEHARSIGSDLDAVNPRDLSQVEMEYEALHASVGSTLIDHHFGMFKLPAKEGAFDWSLGPGIASIGDDYDADYALFVFYRDYQASGGRVAFSILAAVAGVGIPMGAEQGFASLVDLKSGDVVWFNMVNVGKGELRKKESAAQTVAALFKNMPTGIAVPSMPAD